MGPLSDFAQFESIADVISLKYAYEVYLSVCAIPNMLHSFHTLVKDYLVLVPPGPNQTHNL